MTIFKFDELEKAPLIIDAIYEGGSSGNISDEPLCKLLPKTANQGGFRVTKRIDEIDKPAYVVIYSTMNEIEWPDSLDAENGIFRYYGDNREPGSELHNTSRKGNLLLKNVFEWLSLGGRFLSDIPPFLIFKKAEKGRDVKFLGLAVPGNRNIPPDRDLISFWRSKGENRFLNYEAYFTILDTKDDEITKTWLNELVCNHTQSIEYAPKCWKKFILQGRAGIKAMKASRIASDRTIADQLPSNRDDLQIIQTIIDRFSTNPFCFEYCATEIVKMMDSNFINFELTRPWRDGGRDALGKYRIGSESNFLYVECSLEAKCNSLKNGVGIKQMSRLISRIKYRQFGILVTTSYVNKQACKEVNEDGHPVLIITAKDIVQILKRNGLNLANIRDWLNSLES